MRQHSDDAIPQDWQPRNARGLAASVLGSAAHEFPSVALSARLDASNFSSSERRLATELVCGIVRREATLDVLIGAHLSRPMQSLETGLQLLLRLGTYQLVFLDSIPAHAALHETVELAKQIGRPRWSGLLNGVLRSIDRSVTSEVTDAPAADAFPLRRGVFRRCLQPIFPDPIEHRLEYLAKAFSFPQWLLERWIAHWSEIELSRFVAWFNDVAPLYLRVNRLKTDRDTLLSMLRDSGVEASLGSLDDSIQLEGTARVTELPGFDAGLFCVQDETAMNASLMLDPQPGETILDLCAAPGTKTTHLAELMRNEGRIVATDINAERLDAIHSATQRLGISIIETHTIDRDGSGLPNGPFDAILVDAPCSNTGVLGKRPEARWRLTPADISELSAIPRLRPGGRLLYSTCSIDAEENEAVARSCLNQGLTMNSTKTFLPGDPSDGGFLALMCGDGDDSTPGSGLRFSDLAVNGA